MKIKYTFVFGLAANVGIGFLVLGIGLSYFNALTKTLHGNYKYHNKYVIENQDLFNSIISGWIPLGAIFGSILISPFMSKGRRFSQILIAIITIIGTAITMIFDMTALIIGRLIIGMWIGAYVSLSPLYASEIAPSQISGTVGAVNQLGWELGIFIGLWIGLIVPLEEDSDAYTSGNWRIVFMFPGIAAAIQLVFMLLVFRYDTPKFYKIKNDTLNYEASLKQLYDMTEEELKNFEKETEDSTPVSDDSPAEKASQKNIDKSEEFEDSQQKVVIDQIDDENVIATMHRKDEVDAKEKKSGMSLHYKKALIYGIIYSSAHQLSGINAVIFYSNELFTNGETGNSAERKARYGSLLVGVFSLIGITISLITLKYFARLKLNNFWQAVMLVCLVIMAIFALADVQIGLIFAMAFNAGIGGIVWVYTAETLDGNGWAIVGLANMFWAFIFGGFSNFMIIVFTAPGFYFGLSVIQGFIIVFIWIFLKETKGLTKAQWETLYIDKKVEIDK